MRIKETKLQGKLLELPDSKHLFPNDEIWVPGALETFQNNSSLTVQCPKFGIKECDKFPQNNLFLPIEDLIMEKDIVMD